MYLNWRLATERKCLRKDQGLVSRSSRVDMSMRRGKSGGGSVCSRGGRCGGLGVGTGLGRRKGVGGYERCVCMEELQHEWRCI